MADTEKLTLAVDIEIAKHDLLLDRFVAEIEKRVEAVTGQRDANKNRVSVEQRLVMLQAEHAQTKRSLDTTCRDYDNQHRNLAELTGERDKTMKALDALKKSAELYLGFVHTKAKPALLKSAASDLGEALVRAERLLAEEIPL